MSNDHLTDIAYRHFIESVKDYAIYMLSTDGTVISWNEGARRAKGYLNDEIIGCYFGLFYSEAEQLSGVPAKNLEIALRSGQFEGEGWRFGQYLAGAVASPQLYRKSPRDPDAYRLSGQPA